jgi:hypothetical protein
MSRESVIRQIVERDQTGQHLTEETVLRDLPDLHQLACKQFGTWDTALKYAGVSLRRLRAERNYSRERVIQKIRALCQNGGCLQAVNTMRRDRGLYDAALRLFGGWRRALQAAGIEVQRAGLRSKPRRRLDKPKILEALRQRHQAGHSLSWACVCMEDRDLATAAKHAFNGWRRALVAAGLPAESQRFVRRPKWDEQRVLDAIRVRKQDGKPLHYRGVYTDNCGLYRAAIRYFGGWKQALAAAGVGPVKRAARHYFGSWRNALAAAGVEAEQAPRGRRGQKG